MRFTHICNPENRRAAFFRDACKTLGLPAPEEVAWADLLQCESVPEFTTDAIRIESPGENFEVESLLIHKGGGPSDLEEERGRIRWHRAWYDGWKEALEEIAKRNPSTQFMNSPEDIATMFHKSRCQITMRNQGVPVPEHLCSVMSYQQLRHEMEQNEVKRVFVKPDHGSSASGVIALQTGTRGRIMATAPVELVTEDATQNVSAYNTLRIRNYVTESDVEQLVDTLVPQGIFAERWFPKASINGRVFDLRVVVIAGEARNVVVRTSRGPITNLHLGNERGEVEEVRERLGIEKWNEAMTVCEQAAAVFPKCQTVAVDLMIGTGFRSFAVAEVNAFGDLLPKVLSRGDDTYTAALRSFLEQSPDDGV